MKEKVFGFLKAYRYCLLTGAFLVLIFWIIRTWFGDVILVEREILDMTAQSVYMLIAWPCLCAIHGVLTCLFLKRMCIPSVVLATTTWMFMLLVTVPDFSWFWPVVAFAFSFSAALMTKAITVVVRVTRDVWAEE
jgi:Na+-driven multidrug efflux pump